MRELPSIVTFLGIGKGFEEVKLLVSYWAEYPRGVDEFKSCAFCVGDPCAEESPPDSRIARFYALNTWADTCPVCRGRPT